jgi:elongation factor 1-alpha
LDTYTRKTTLVGHLLLQSGVILNSSYPRRRKFRFVLTSSKKKEQRSNIDLAHARFDTPKYEFTILDCPGHRDFVKNRSRSIPADAAVLVEAIDDGVMPQTKEHAFLARTLGINH